jgi:hypothetical protein
MYLIAVPLIQPKNRKQTSKEQSKVLSDVFKAILF